MTFVELFILGLAAWRLAYFITHEAGPGSFMETIRGHIIGPEDIMPPGPGSLGKLFTCVYCMSFWTAGGLYLAWLIGWGGPLSLIDFLAIWGLATFLQMVGPERS